jgi:deazaflavin-dependent oxidoreductase (nitroreductase family)
MPSDFTLKTMNRVHRVLLKVSGGRIGRKLGVMPVVELATIGRKSGNTHTVLLTSPVQEGDTVVLVASRGGDDHHPAWFLNLQAQPDVEAAVGSRPLRPMRAVVADPEERSRLWPQVTSTYKGYANYQSKTDREIPLVLLTPRD